MKKTLTLSFVLIAFALGFWTGCTVDTGAVEVGGEFPCQDESDCISGFICVDNLCEKKPPAGGDKCIDKDNDGYGVGDNIEDRQDCGKCTTIGDCDIDCNDNDPDINPGAPEPCNNIDDNCNDIVDDETPCESASDCAGLPAPEFGAYTCLTPADGLCTPGSTDCSCQLRMIQTICLGDPGCPCNDSVQMCTAGMFPALPDPAQCN